MDREDRLGVTAVDQPNQLVKDSTTFLYRKSHPVDPLFGIQFQLDSYVRQCAILT